MTICAACSPTAGWIPLLLGPLLVIGLFPASLPGWAFMWTLAFVIFCGCKWLTWRRTPIAASLSRNLGYLFAWPGLDACAFLGSSGDRTFESPSPVDWLGAALKTAVGVSLFVWAARILYPTHAYIAGWVGMVGIVLTLHFGLFALLSCGWRAAGVDARPLMNHPLAADSPSDFWGRRWNTAFRDLIHRFAYRPLVDRLGARNAVLAGFLFSGLVHELVISLPAGGGFGGPTVFFAVQGLAIAGSRTRQARMWGLCHGGRGRLLTIAGLVVTAPLLFHRPFVLGIIVPFMLAIGVL